MFKKSFLLIISVIFLFLIEACSSVDLYRFNYPDDIEMQKRMEKDYGDIPFFNEDN